MLELAEPVTPELALVDPELARRERARLPDVVPWSPDVKPASTAREPDLPATASAHRQAPVVARRSRPLALALTLAVAITAAALVLGWSTDDRPRLLSGPGEPSADEATAPVREGADAPSEQTRPTLPEPPARPSRAGQPPSQQTRPTSPEPPARPSRAGQSQKRKATTEKAKPRPPPATAPAVAEAPQTFVWLPVENATHYKVEFLRGGKRVLLAFPSRPRLVIAGSWRHRGRAMRFRAGRYLWVVRAGFGPRSSPRYGQPTVRSSWTFIG